MKAQRGSSTLLGPSPNKIHRLRPWFDSWAPETKANYSTVLARCNPRFRPNEYVAGEHLVAFGVLFGLPDWSRSRRAAEGRQRASALASPSRISVKCWCCLSH